MAWRYAEQAQVQPRCSTSFSGLHLAVVHYAISMPTPPSRSTCQFSLQVTYKQFYGSGEEKTTTPTAKCPDVRYYRRYPGSIVPVLCTSITGLPKAGNNRYSSTTCTYRTEYVMGTTKAANTGPMGSLQEVSHLDPGHGLALRGSLIPLRMGWRGGWTLPAIQ